MKEWNDGKKWCELRVTGYALKDKNRCMLRVAGCELDPLRLAINGLEV